MDDKKNNSIKERAPETQLLVQFMRDAEGGVLLTFEELSEVIGQSVRPGSKGYVFLRSAIKIVRNEHRKTFVNIARVGYKHCVTPAEFEKIARGERNGISRKCGTAIKKLRNAKIEEFPDESRCLILANMTLFHLQKEEAKQKNVEKMKVLTNGLDAIAPVQKTLSILLEQESKTKT